MKNSTKQKVVAFGFDRWGFELPTKNSYELGENTKIQFVKFSEKIDLSDFDGAILPSGIFEEKYFKQTFPGSLGRYPIVKCEAGLLGQCERQAYNMLEQLKWVCFLVGNIYDDYCGKDCSNTDLSKRLLRDSEIRYQSIGLAPQTYTKENEFKIYARKFGGGGTCFYFSAPNDNEIKVLFEAKEHIFGLEVNGALFFLPYQSSNRDADTLVESVSLVSEAVIRYRQKSQACLPDWIHEFQFDNERLIQREIENYHQKLNEKRTQLKKWQSYKSILTTSDDNLRLKVIEILQNYFALTIDSKDDNKEDAKILDKNANIIGVVEITGTTSGVRASKVNQVHTHRIRSKIPSSVPGSLIINCDMNKKGVNKRSDSKVHPDQIHLAVTQKILIIRTIDLLYLMRLWENKDLEYRRSEFIKILNTSGWLKADPKGFNILIG